MQRKSLQPAFSFRHIKDLYPIFWAKGVEMVKVMERELELGSAAGNRLIRMDSYASRATLDVIGVAGMDCDFKALQDPGNELNRQYRLVTRDSPLSSRILFLIGLLTSCSRLMIKVPTKFNRQVTSASAAIRGIARQMIHRKKERLEAEKNASISLEKTERDDVDIVSVALRSGTFSEGNMTDQMMTFLGAGHETTASSLQWAVYYLARYQDVQTRLRDEVRANLPPLSSSQGITAEAVDSLPFLNAVCNEVFRYRPPVRSTLRVSVRDTMLVGVPIPKGTTIMLSPEVINHDKSLWGEDANEFNPDRWMGPGRANTGGATSNYAMLTFLHGPHSCIGQGFTKSELACLLATVVGRYHVEAMDSITKDPEMTKSITVKPKDGALAKFTPIEGW